MSIQDRIGHAFAACNTVRETPVRLWLSHDDHYRIVQYCQRYAAAITSVQTMNGVPVTTDHYRQGSRLVAASGRVFRL